MASWVQDRSYTSYQGFYDATILSSFFTIHTPFSPGFMKDLGHQVTKHSFNRYGATKFLPRHWQGLVANSGELEKWTYGFTYDRNTMPGPIRASHAISHNLQHHLAPFQNHWALFTSPKRSKSPRQISLSMSNIGQTSWLANRFPLFYSPTTSKFSLQPLA